VLTWTPEDAIEDGQPAPRSGRVIGVIRDFQPSSFRTRTPPMLFVNNPDLYETFVVSVPDSAFGEARTFLEAQWDRHVPRRNFEYTILDEHVDALYRSEQQTALLVRVFAGVALFVACLGLLGLAAFTVEQRTKEIGVRKALGASAASIVALLSAQFARTVLVACAVGAPVAYLLARRWLDGFAYPFDLGPTVFLLAVCTTLGIALIAVGTQALRAARLDPATTLKDE
jgi:putative ABC transport system permease protein